MASKDTASKTADDKGGNKKVPVKAEEDRVPLVEKKTAEEKATEEMAAQAAAVARRGKEKAAEARNVALQEKLDGAVPGEMVGVPPSAGIENSELRIVNDEMVEVTVEERQRVLYEGYYCAALGGALGYYGSDRGGGDVLCGIAHDMAVASVKTYEGRVASMLAALRADSIAE